MTKLQLDLAHPYTRYGLAVALFRAGVKPEEVTEEKVRESLAVAIEEGLGKFRMRTLNDPEKDEELRYRYITVEGLKGDVKKGKAETSFFKSGLSDNGIFLAPTIVVNESDTQQTEMIKRLFEQAVEIAEDLRREVQPKRKEGGDVKENESSNQPQKISLATRKKISRAISPLTAEINNGKPDSEAQKMSLLERACCVVATITSLKAAAKVGKSNTAIYPDLPLPQLFYFVKYLNDMLTSQTDADLMTATVARKPQSENGKIESKRQKSKRDRSKQGESAESEDGEEEKTRYPRPKICYGNYPHAPRLKGVVPFGGASLLAAVGRWARSYGRLKREEARKVLESIVGAENSSGKSLYIVSYEGTSQENYKHYIVDLALEHNLSELIDSLAFHTRLYTDMGKGKVNRQSEKYRLFYSVAHRFLQQFTVSAFNDFLSFQAEYSPNIKPLFRGFFMKAQEIDSEIVDAAAAYGQWLNKSAYKAAVMSVGDEIRSGAPHLQDPKKRRERIEETKAKILIELESAMSSAPTPQAMLGLLASRTLRLMQPETPQDAVPFITAVATGKLKPKTAQSLVAAFMRVSSFQQNLTQTTDVGGYPDIDDGQESAQKTEQM